MGYPRSTSRSIVIRPIAAASAASDPEMHAKKPQPSAVEVPKPDRMPPVVASAKSRSLFASPERTMTSPVSTNSGIAIKAKESTP